MMFRSITCCVFCFFYSTGVAQLDQTKLELPWRSSDSIQEQALNLRIGSHSFFRNNEFFEKMAQGYTLFGTLLNTELVYQAHSNLSLSAGIFMRKDFGASGFQQIEPRFTITVHGRRQALLFGNLEAQVSHRLIEPLLDYESFIQHHTEQGIQFKTWHPSIWSDTWISWDRMQYLGSDYQERFTAGHSSCIPILKKNTHDLSVILQGMVHHRGGQLDIDSTPLQTVFQGAAGFRYRKQSEGFIREWNAEALLVHYQDLSPTVLMPSSSGSGVHANLRLTSKHGIGIALQYWKAADFLSLRGGSLYQSRSSETARIPTYSRQRQLMFCRAFYQKELVPHLYCDLRFEPYYDLIESYFEYSYGLYLSYRSDFRLLSGKRIKAANAQHD